MVHAIEDDYLEHQKLSSLKELEKKSKPVSQTKSGTKENTYENQKEQRGAKRKIAKLEKQIANLEKELKTLDFDLEVEYEKTISQPDFFENYQAKKKELGVLMEQWEALQLSLE